MTQLVLGADAQTFELISSEFNNQSRHVLLLSADRNRYDPNLGEAGARNIRKNGNN